MKVSRQKHFAVFAVFCMSTKLFYIMALSRYGFKIKYVCGIPRNIFHKDLRVQLATKLFCLETFMAYGTYYVALKGN